MRMTPSERASLDARLEARLKAWRLTPDGAGIEADRALLAPVLRRGEALMLRVSDEPDARSGRHALVAFAGAGAVRLAGADGTDSLVERARPGHSLEAWLGRLGDEACADVIGNVVLRMHARPVRERPPGLIPLRDWFRGLVNDPLPGLPALGRAREVAISLLDAAGEPRALHGDLHHGNLVWDDRRGWLAIDPKGIWGERAFEFAPAVLNPMIRPDLVLAPGRAEALCRGFAARSGVAADRILMFAAAYAGLSAAWTCADGGDPRVALGLCELLTARLDA